MKNKFKNRSSTRKINMICIGVALVGVVAVYTIEWMK